MDEVVRTVAALGLPGVILVIAMATKGFTGAAAITTALAFLGGPAGMLGGIAALGVTGLIAQALSTVGVYGLLTEVYRYRPQSAVPRNLLLNEINNLPIMDMNLRHHLREVVIQNSPN